MIQQNSTQMIFFIFCKFFDINEKCVENIHNHNSTIINGPSKFPNNKMYNEDLIDFRENKMEESNYIRFLFYNNFDSYYNMKYVLKNILINLEKNINLNEINRTDIQNKLELIIIR